MARKIKTGNNVLNKSNLPVLYFYGKFEVALFVVAKLMFVRFDIENAFRCRTLRLLRQDIEPTRASDEAANRSGILFRLNRLHNYNSRVSGVFC